jgi:hypothetical protein
MGENYMTAQPQPTLSSMTGTQPDMLASIYQENLNIAIWQRGLLPALNEAVNDILQASQSLQITCTVGLDNCFETLFKALGRTESAKVLAQDIHFLVDMYSCLFDLDRVGLRIAKLDHAMCPKFHVDRVPVRLVTTYHGAGSDWLPNTLADRTKLGVASVGIPDEESGVYQHTSDIQRVAAGDVVLLKGESWIGNEGNGIVHRSPSVTNGASRLVVTFDFSTDE